MKIALVSYQVQKRYAEGLKEDEDDVLIRFLVNKGLAVERVVWDDLTVNWENYGVVVIKSPWDYHEKYEAFESWLHKLDQLSCTVLNPVSLIRWNSHKKYLLEIGQAGFDVIPSVVVSDGSSGDLSVLFETFANEKIILKPCISAGANNTMVLTQAMLKEKKNEIDALMAKQDFIIQPFMPQISQGEYSLLFFNGKFSHGLVKIPASGDFRVQHYFGGTFSRLDPDPEMIDTAGTLVKNFASDALYARVDGIMAEGKFLLMEIELIEPLLYMSVAPESYENYYAALRSMIGQKSHI